MTTPNQAELFRTVDYTDIAQGMTDRIYPNLKADFILCLQLEQDGSPVDFMVLEDPKEFTGSEYLDSDRDPFAWFLAIPDQLLECLKDVGARYLESGLARIPNFEIFNKYKLRR